MAIDEWRVPGHIRRDLPGGGFSIYKIEANHEPGNYGDYSRYLDDIGLWCYLQDIEAGARLVKRLLSKDKIFAEDLPTLKAISKRARESGESWSWEQSILSVLPIAIREVGEWFSISYIRGRLAFWIEHEWFPSGRRTKDETNIYMPDMDMTPEEEPPELNAISDAREPTAYTAGALKHENVFEIQRGDREDIAEWENGMKAALLKLSQKDLKRLKYLCFKAELTGAEKRQLYRILEKIGQTRKEVTEFMSRNG